MFKVKVIALKLNETTSEGFYFPSSVILQSINDLSFPLFGKLNDNIVIHWEKAEIENDKLLLYGESDNPALLKLLSDGVNLGVVIKGYAEFHANKKLKFIDIHSIDVTTEINDITMCIFIIADI